jgi:16S rRNA (uracil1498-N3)-methyltransferase
MPRDQFFVSGIRAIGDVVALAPDDARKLRTVLRAQTGDAVQIVDAAGATFAATVQLTGTSVDVVLDSALTDASARTTRESAARIVLAQAIPKGQKMDFIVEKATELGVAALIPLRSARVVGERTGDHKRERWQRIAKSAAQQAGRTHVPSIDDVTEWATLHATFAAYDRVYLPWENATATPLRARFEREASAARSILIVVGPEGGFAVEEVRAAEALGAVPISLGARILRTETAALVVLAALLYARGEL